MEKNKKNSKNNKNGNKEEKKDEKLGTCQYIKAKHILCEKFSHIEEIYKILIAYYDTLGLGDIDVAKAIAERLNSEYQNISISNNYKDGITRTEIM